MEDFGNDRKLIRFEIDNFDELIEDPVIEDIISELSKITAVLLSRYEIPEDRFKLIIGSNPIDKLLNL